VAAAVVKGQHVVAHHPGLEAHAAGALDATLAVKHDQVAQRDVLGQVHLFFKDHPAGAGAMPHGQVLQRALAALVADRAIQRVAAEQELQDILAGFLHLGGGGADVQPGAGHGGAGGLQLAPPANLGRAIRVKDQFPGGPVANLKAEVYQAHAAHADRFHLGVVTENRDLHPGIDAGRVHQIHAIGHIIGDAVNMDGDDLVCHSSAFCSPNVRGTATGRPPAAIIRHKPAGAQPVLF